MTFAILYRDPNPALQLIAEARVLYVYVILCLLCLHFHDPGRRSMPCRHEKEKHSKAVSKWSFLSKIRLNITQHVFKMK